MHDDDSNRKGHLLISGASSGIGRRLAISLSLRYDLILNGRDLARLEETKRSCHSTAEVSIWRYDLKDITGIAKSLSQFLQALDRPVTAFIHCAAIFKILALRSHSLEYIQEVMNVNCLSAIEISKILLDKKQNNKMLRNMVLISSIASQFGAKGLAAYAASKGALDAWMKSAAIELAPSVRVNSVLPGAIYTEMTKDIFDDPEVEGRLKRDYPLGFGQPEDIINAVEFLISEKSRWITGQQMIIDGGRTVNITA